MHWVIQKKLFKPMNFKLLVDALEALGISYSSVHIPNGTFDLEPEVANEKKVYVCGAIKLKKVAENRGWKPGSFLNENFSFDEWLSNLGSELLNSDASFGKTFAVKTSHMDKFFIRPLEDNKAFDGAVIDNETLLSWKSDSSRVFLEQLDVIVSPIKEIYREYRLFYVKNKFVTGSAYKVSGKPQISPEVDESVIAYANKIIKKWSPAESFVIDICLTEKGYKVIEFNNINSSGFYACNVPKYIQAIQNAYS